MIPLPLLLPLLASGVVGAVLRQTTQHKKQATLPQLTPQVSPSSAVPDIPPVEPSFDDLGELHHYQKVSWYSLAFAASGTFYPPVSLISIPLLGYNAYHFGRVLRHTDAAGRKSPTTVFEGITLTATIATGQFTTAAVLFLLSFGSRKLLLQAGNIAAVGFPPNRNSRSIKVWILRDGVEIETPLREVQTDDVIVLRGGDTVVVEGKVLEGHGLVRQYSLLKKQKAVPKQLGDYVFPFTQLESGCLHVQRH